MDYMDNDFVVKKIFAAKKFVLYYPLIPYQIQPILQQAR